MKRLFHFIILTNKNLFAEQRNGIMRSIRVLIVRTFFFWGIEFFSTTHTNQSFRNGRTMVDDILVRIWLMATQSNSRYDMIFFQDDFEQYIPVKFFERESINPRTKWHSNLKLPSHKQSNVSNNLVRTMFKTISAYPPPLESFAKTSFTQTVVY